MILTLTSLVIFILTLFLAEVSGLPSSFYLTDIYSESQLSGIFSDTLSCVLSDTVCDTLVNVWLAF